MPEKIVEKNLIKDNYEIMPIPYKHPSNLQVFLEAFFSPLSIFSWVFLLMLAGWVYLEIFIFNQ